jgi:hypothetical protein
VLSLVALFLRIVPQNHSLLAIVIFRFHLASGNLADVLSQDKEELVWYSIHHQLGVSPQVVSLIKLDPFWMISSHVLLGSSSATGNLGHLYLRSKPGSTKLGFSRKSWYSFQYLIIFDPFPPDIMFYNTPQKLHLNACWPDFHFGVPVMKGSVNPAKSPQNRGRIAKPWNSTMSSGLKMGS